MSEIKILGEVRWLIKAWRKAAKDADRDRGSLTPKPLPVEWLKGFSAAKGDAANELEAALKRPIQRERKRAKKRSKK